METISQLNTMASGDDKIKEGPRPLWELVVRTCKCGCGQKWKTLPTSKNEYASERHEKGYKIQSMLFDFDESDGTRRSPKSLKGRAVRHLTLLRFYPLENPSVDKESPLTPTIESDDQ